MSLTMTSRLKITSDSKVVCNSNLLTLSKYAPLEIHPLQWTVVVSTAKSSATHSTFFCENKVYEAKMKSWAFELAKIMATPSIAVPFGKLPANLRTTAFFSRCGCGYVFSSSCKQRGHPFPELFDDILSEIMPVAGIISHDFWPTCVNVTWYRNGYETSSFRHNLKRILI